METLLSVKRDGGTGALVRSSLSLYEVLDYSYKLLDSQLLMQVKRLRGAGAVLSPVGQAGGASL